MRRASAARLVAAIAAIGSLGVVAHERDAAACGACFVNASESTVVSDHRMALAITTQRTILWDQIQYTGNPAEFAYVIPARAGTRLEISNDAWFAALDASTRPIIMSPQSYGGGGGYPNGGGGGGGGYGGYSNAPRSTSSGGGCCSSMDPLFSAEAAGSGFPSSSADASAAGGNSAGASQQADPVQIVEQQVIGPYETVTLRSDDPQALQKWLTANGFALPPSAEPILADYVADKLDFIAMRLRPSQNVRAMEPIRIVTPGADATLPLRMMKIGAGAKLGITLFVLGEGRYHPKNFPDAVIPESALVWDYAKRISNYQQLSIGVMTAGKGDAFLTEYAKKPELDYDAPLPSSGVIGNPGLAPGYAQLCPRNKPYVPSDAGTSFGNDSGSASDAASDDASAPMDAGIADADALDAGSDSGSADSGVVDAGPPRKRTLQCDDLDFALEGMHPPDVWVTRMRAFLPSEALDTPLQLEPTPVQAEYENIHVAPTTGVVSAGLGRIPGPGERGTYAIVLAACAVLWRVLRRRKAA